MPSFSEVFGDFLELVDGGALISRRVSGLFEAVVDMVMNQRFLSRYDGLLDGRELLCDVETGALRLDHLDDLVDMTFGAFEAPGDIDVGLVLVNLLFPGSPAYPPQGDRSSPYLPGYLPGTAPGSASVVA